MALSVIGMDFRTAPVTLREQVAMSPDLCLELLHAIKAERLLPEAIIVSTCNRTEFYGVAPETERSSGSMRDGLLALPARAAKLRGLAAPLDPAIFFHHQGPRAVEHLFRVACSLESQIVGEHEILGQVKQAYRLACEAGTAGFLLHKLLHWAFRVGKRVLSETDLGQGSSSVSQAAVSLAQQIFTHLSDKTVLLIGAGQTAQLVVQALVRTGIRGLIVANRTVERARQLAQSAQAWAEQRPVEPETPGLPGDDPSVVSCPALLKDRPDEGGEAATPTPSAAAGPGLTTRAIGLDEIPSVIAGADLVISSTGAGEPILTYQELSGRLGKISHPLLLIDIAVPRDIDPKLEKLPNVFLYNIDGLEALVAQNVARREREIPRAEAIVADEVERFWRWRSGLEVVPTIKLLAEKVRAIQLAEVDRYHRRFGASDRAELEEFARVLCGKLLHSPIAFLRELSHSDDPDADAVAVDTLRRIFQLDAEGPGDRGNEEPPPPEAQKREP